MLPECTQIKKCRYIKQNTAVSKTGYKWKITNTQNLQVVKDCCTGFTQIISSIFAFHSEFLKTK
jgi:hypothetical protein